MPQAKAPRPEAAHGAAPDFTYGRKAKTVPHPPAQPAVFPPLMVVP